MESLTLTTDTKLETGQDYGQLRALGMEYIQQFCAETWSDHNLHDPGITTLELLSYALTDLSYRASFSTKDLLVPESGYISDSQISGFFPAQDILPNTTLTQLDYRQLLLKIEGIRNAWLQPLTDPQAPASEVPIYLDHLAERLSLDPKNSSGQDNESLHLSGLYQVLLELEPDPELGTLNESELTFVLRSTLFKGRDGALDYLQATALLLTSDALQQWAAAAEWLTQEVPTVTLEPVSLWRINVRVSLSTGDLAPLTLQLQQPAPDPAVDDDWLMLLSPAGDDLLLRFARKQAQILKVLTYASAALHDSRNLCEDYRAVTTVAADYIAICSDIEVAPAADLELVQAHVYFAVEQYLNPPVHYYSLSEMLAAGIPADEVYTGPYINRELQVSDTALGIEAQPVFTKPGFNKADELANSELRTAIHSSDIIAAIMALDDVVAVKSLSLRKYSAAGHPSGDSERWCLSISPGHQPVLTIAHSKVLFFKRSIPYLGQSSEFQSTLRYLRAAAAKASYSGSEEALIAPVGEYRNTKDHYPVQHDFPQTYQIGEAGLKAGAEPQRIEQARQMKGYLLFFEQVLADYLAQLANLPHLFSLDSGAEHSYYSQYLSNIQATLGTFEDEFYIDKGKLQDELQRSALWEDEASYQARKNRLLDHLLARFGEQFNDYVLMLYQQNGDTLKSNQTLITDKTQFLQSLPVISRERNRGFNYRPTALAAIWNSDNVSGLEKRVALLTSMDNFARRDLSCDKLLTTLFDTRKHGNEFRVEIKDPSQHLLFKSVELFVSRDEAMAQAVLLYGGLDADNAILLSEPDSDGHQTLTIEVDAVRLTHDAELSVADAAALATAIRQRYTAVSAEATEEDPASVLFDTRQTGNDYRLEIKDRQQFILFKSVALFASREEAMSLAARLFVGVRERKNFHIDSSGGPGTIELSLRVGDDLLVHEQGFDTVADADQVARDVIDRYREILGGIHCASEGFYLIEHLLLRPRTDQARLLTACIDSSSGCGDEDPYSFRASVILPYWPTRFQQAGFRRFFEHTIREQAPAHIHLKICWIDHHQMEQLEQVYQQWCQQMATQPFDSASLTQAQNQLITQLAQLKSVYPAAVLHDCRDDDTTTPVRLGSTNLGVD
ncbi:hypothetical protein DU002_09080 [Corallincola holothuriorum]|uniref:Uncharacterized protein n=1 Tax=Corallincola holothuriorum TaxID=2282215 RepID=A0A368NMM4_9GAMM|nr:hypothetical protein [Corallincola holothuriorum]RCU50561.1 hypothetical protein DU002_09080 [Corallincola holothuriorum]